jgi:hypothetical protein
MDVPYSAVDRWIKGVLGLGKAFFPRFAKARRMGHPVGSAEVKRTGNYNGKGKIQGSLHCGGKCAAFGRDDDVGVEG